MKTMRVSPGQVFRAEQVRLEWEAALVGLVPGLILLPIPLLPGLLPD